MNLPQRLWTALPRPLDPMRSIKIQLGLPAVCNACAGGELGRAFNRMAADLAGWNNNAGSSSPTSPTSSVLPSPRCGRS